MTGYRSLFSNQENVVDEDSVILKQDDRYSMTAFESFLVMINNMIGVGPFKVSKRFECGIIITTAINAIVCLLMYYANWMLIKVMAIQKTFSYETSWEIAVGKGSWIASFLNIISTIPFVSWFFINAKFLIESFLNDVWPGAPWALRDVYVVSAILSVIFSFPAVFQQHSGYITKLGYLSGVLLIFLFAGHIFNFVVSVKTQGFDPLGRLVMANPAGNMIGAVSEFIGCYTAFMYTLPNMRTTKKLTLKRSRHILAWAFFFCFCVYEIFGLMGFIMYNGVQADEIILDLLPHNSWVISAMYIILAVKVASGIPGFLNAGRESSLALVKVMKTYPKTVYVVTGIIANLMAITFASLSGTYLSAMNILLNFCVMSLNFIIPAIMLFRKRKILAWYHSVLSIVCIVLGCGFAIFSILGELM